MIVRQFSCVYNYDYVITSPEAVFGIYNMSIAGKTGRHGASETLVDIEIMPDGPNWLGLAG